MTDIQKGLFGSDFAASSKCIDGDVCAECEEKIEGNIRKNPDGDDICEGCYDDAGYQECDRCGEVVDGDDTVEVAVSFRWGNANSHEFWCESCADSHATRCDDCSDYVANEFSRRTASGDDICDHCYDHNYFTCGDCGDVYSNDDCISTDYDCYCPDCAPRTGGNYSPGYFQSNGSITEIGSARRFGVEIETDDCNGYEDMEDYCAFGAKDDCSVGGKEFYSAILSGDSGLAEIRKFAAYAEDSNWECGDGCGFHLHLDLTYESNDSKWATVYAYAASKDVWHAFVDQSRCGFHYCGSTRWTCGEVDDNASSGRDYGSWACNTGRNWIAPYAWSSHRTIEVRLARGTTDGRYICNWVKAHTRFVDWACTLGFAAIRDKFAGRTSSEIFDIIAREAWQDDELRTYFEEYAEEVGCSEYVQMSVCV